MVEHGGLDEPLGRALVGVGHRRPRQPGSRTFSDMAGRGLRGAAAATAPVGLQHRIPSLDGLRAFAVVCVLWGHSSATIHSVPRPLEQVMRFLPYGDFGVQVFFVISGFLITALLLSENRGTGRISFKDFYRRRAYRILPALYVFLLVVAILWATGLLKLSPVPLVASALFVKNYTPSGGTWWLGHMWSLSVEEQFYLLWPLLLSRFNRRWLPWFIVAGIVLSPLVRLVTWVSLPAARPAIGEMFHTRADALLIGCLLALLWQENRFQSAVNVALRRGVGWAAIAWLLASWALVRPFGDMWKYSAGYLCDALAIATIMVWVIRSPATPGGRLLNSRVVRHVGVLSYSLYLWQQLFLTSQNTSLFGRFPVNLAAALAAAEVSYWLVERPFLRLRARRTRMRASTAPVRVGGT